MASKLLKEKISEGLLILDGAMGTQLFARGIEPGTCNDYANIESPKIVRSVHQDYIKAGSDAVLTNTFGANKIALARHGYGEKVQEINLAAVKIARDAAGDEKYVLGDIGPSGDFLKPVGTLEPEELKTGFLQQAEALVNAGVDGLIIETMTAIEEIEIAIEAVKSVSGNLPVFASMSFDSSAGNFRTIMGVDVETAVSKTISLDVDAVGFNCGKASLDEYVELAAKFAVAVKACGRDVALLAEPNAGLPEMVGADVVYKVSPKDFAKAVEKICAAGATIIGGCCGTTPKHIKAVARYLKR